MSTQSIDPKVLAIMAKLEEEERAMTDKTPDAPKPPTTFEEFLQFEGLKEWPRKLSAESTFNIKSETLLLGSQEEIEEILREAAPLPIHLMDRLEERLERIEEVLQKYAHLIIADDSKLQLLHSPSRTFMTDSSDQDNMARSLVSTKSASRQSNMDIADSLLESRKYSVEYCIFPGFQHGELIELPGQLEGPPLLHRVTKAQDFNPGFKKFWKKIFLSEASVAVMQDMFWWVFLDRFQKGKKEDKDCLFDRLADSFVALFQSINTDVKDKFLMAYPDCLAQSVFLAFCESFPESKKLVDCESFKQYILDLVYEWTSGIKLTPGLWRNWNVDRLKQGQKENDVGAAAKQMIAAATENKKGEKYSLDIESFEKYVQRLGETEDAVVSSNGLSREVTKLTNMTTPTPATPGSANVFSQSRPGAGGLPRRGTGESHRIGPGAELERVKFNLQGRSPLVAHYLHKRQLRDFKHHGKTVRRTEITAMPPPGQTYRQLINNTLTMSDSLNKEYQRICEHTNQEIFELEKRKRETNREIDKLQRELMFTKNALELKILSERIVEFKDRSKAASLFTSESRYSPDPEPMED